MSIYLIRHGETLLNVARTLQPADTPLGPRGLAQAQALAQRLAGAGLRRLISSDLPRAWQTAQAIAHTTGLPIEGTPLLHERNFGDLRGRGYDSLGFNPLAMEDAPPGGESAAQFQARVAQAFALVLKAHTECGGPVAVVTHGLVIRALLTHHTHLPEGQSAPLRLGNTSVTVLSPEPPHTVELLDCTRHLDALTGDDALSLSGG